MAETKQPLEERLMGQQVALEVKQYAGSGETRAQTLHYSGIFCGIDTLGNRDLVKLTDGNYYSSTFRLKTTLANNPESYLFYFKEAYIKFDDVISVAISDNEKKK